MISEKKENSNILYIIVIVLLILIAIGAYFLGKNSTTTKVETDKTIETIIVYDDERCTDCNTNAIIEKLKQIPNLANTNFEVKDYKKDSSVKKFLNSSKIKTLPLFIFPTNNIDVSLNEYLNKSENDDTYLLVGGNFNPISFDLLDAREETPKTLDVFSMGYCPFGEIAMKAIPEIQEAFKNDDIKINIHYIATKTGTGNTASSFQSLHGISEAEENIRQLCINKNYGVNKVINYSQERYKNADNYGRITDAPEIAMKAVGVDSKKILNCVENGEGAKLLEEDVKIAQELGIGASPTWFANNKYKFGGIKAGNIQTQFCSYNPDLKGCKNQIQNTGTNTGSNPSCN